MSETLSPARRRGLWFRVALAATGVVGLAATAAAPTIAQAYDHHYVRHDYHHYAPPAYGYGVPTYVQSPPPLVYAPPAYASPFNLGLSFNIR